MRQASKTEVTPAQAQGLQGAWTNTKKKGEKKMSATMKVTDQMTLQEFINSEQITASVSQVESNRNMLDMPQGSTHWKLAFRRKRTHGTMTVRFSMGPAHHSKPTTAEVLDCLASDASTFDNSNSFEDWAAEFGFDTDSRQAKKTYRAVEKQTHKLRVWLAGSYETLLWNTERE